MISPSKLLITLTYLLYQCSGQGQTSAPPVSSPPPNPPGVVTSAVDGKTITQTYQATSITDLASITSQTSIETTIAGAIFVGVVFAGGLAWLLPKPPPGEPVLDVPSTPPSEQQPTKTQDPSTQTDPSTTTTSSDKDVGTQRPFILRLPRNYPAFQQPITVPDDELTCGFKNDDKASVDRDDAKSKIEKFCTDKNQTLLASGPVNLDKNDGRIKSGQFLSITVTQNPDCKDDKDQQLDADDCTQYLLQALDNCDTTSQTKFGGTVKDECTVYVLHPGESEGELTCKPVTDGMGLGANRDNALKNIDDHCNSINGKSVSPNAGFLQEYRQKEGDSNLVLEVKYNPACPRGGAATRAIDKESCVRFFNRLVDGCNTDNRPPFGKFGGSLTDECEIYKMDTNVLEEIRCGDPNNIFGGDPHAVDQDTGQKAIDEYCNTDNIALKSPEELKNQGFVQFSPDSGNFNKGLDNWVVRMQAVWDADEEKKCKPATAFKIDKDECKRKYGRVLHECIAKGSNGGMLKDNLEHGCAWYAMAGKVPPKSPAKSRRSFFRRSFD